MAVSIVHKRVWHLFLYMIAISIWTQLLVCDCYTHTQSQCRAFVSSQAKICIVVQVFIFSVEFWGEGVSRMHQGSCQTWPRVGTEERELLTVHSAHFDRNRGIFECVSKLTEAEKDIRTMWAVFNVVSSDPSLSSLISVWQRAILLCCIASHLRWDPTSPPGHSTLYPCTPIHSLSGLGREELESPRWEGEESLLVSRCTI